MLSKLTGMIFTRTKVKNKFAKYKTLYYQPPHDRTFPRGILTAYMAAPVAKLM